MFQFYDSFNYEADKINTRERRLNKRRGGLYHPFNHPHQIAIFDDAHSTIGEMDRFVDQTSSKYSDPNYMGFKGMKKESF